MLNDNFDGRLDTGKWEHEVSLWGGGVSNNVVIYPMWTVDRQYNSNPFPKTKL